MNKYMNVFIPYAQGEPVENNLSRGLAILLNENQFLLDRFIDMVNAKLYENNCALVAKPNNPGGFEVNIQQSVKDLANSGGIRYVVPITLTPEEAADEENCGGAEKPITDISLMCGNNDIADLLIIETKRNGNSAHAQVNHQAESIIKYGLDAKIMPVVIHLKWQDIIQVLQDVQSLQKYNRDSILDDYIDYLTKFCPSWFPVKPFGENVDIWKRIHTLAKNCMEIMSKDGTQVSTGETDFSYTVMKSSWGYMREFHLVPYDANDERTIKNFDHLSIEIWPGNNNSQSRFLFSSSKINDNMSWTRETSIEADGREFEMYVTPYLKFAHIMGKWAGEAKPLLDIFGTDKNIIRTKFVDVLTRRWDRKSWPKLKEILSEYGIAYSFMKDIESSGRNFVDVSVGYYVSIAIPLSVLIELDKHNTQSITPENDKVARLVADIICSLRKKIEK